MTTEQVFPGDQDLPEGYRWANEYESEEHGAGRLPEAIVVPRTTDVNGVPYTQGEADLAVPVECIACYRAARPYDPDKHDSQNCWAGYPG